MSFTYGFYNSVNHDRVYDATQWSAIFDGLIADGVYETQGNKFAVQPSSGMVITVDTGRAWLNHTWSLNDSLLPLTLEPADLVVPRIDAIVIETNTNPDVRANTIKVLTGLPDENPEKPELTKGEFVNQYPLAYVTVEAGTTAITASNIENKVGTSDLPFVIGVVEVMNIDMIIAKWQGEWEDYKDEFKAWEDGFKDTADSWYSDRQDEFEDWFTHLHNELDEHQAANLQRQIDDIEANNPLKIIDGLLCIVYEEEGE